MSPYCNQVVTGTTMIQVFKSPLHIGKVPVFTWGTSIGTSTGGSIGMICPDGISGMAGKSGIWVPDSFISEKINPVWFSQLKSSELTKIDGW